MTRALRAYYDFTLAALLLAIKSATLYRPTTYSLQLVYIYRGLVIPHVGLTHAYIQFAHTVLLIPA